MNQINPLKASRNAYKINSTYKIVYDANYHIFIAPGEYSINVAGEFLYNKDLPFISAKIFGTIELICQISLESFPFCIDKAVNMFLVQEKEIALLEPYIKMDNSLEYYVYDYYIDIESLIKEEILLSLPLIPSSTNNDGIISH